MSTEKQREANRKNAQKSTGPRTEEGKRRASRNAMKDGFTGDGIVLTREDERKLIRKVRKWVLTLMPIDPIEMEYVRRAALASVRVARAVRKDLAELQRRKRNALRRFDRSRRKQAQEVAGLMESRPSLAVRQLMEGAYGCDWLIDQWGQLEEALAGEESWSPEQCELAHRLIGRRPTDSHRDDPLLAALRLQMLVLRPGFGPEAVRAHFGVTAEQMCDPAVRRVVLPQLPDPESARQALRELAQAERQDLERRAERLWLERDGVERQNAADCALVDTSVEGMRLHRYERENELLMHKSLDTLFAMRRQENESYSVKRWGENQSRYGRVWGGRSWTPDPFEPVEPSSYASEIAPSGIENAAEIVPQPGGEIAPQPVSRNEANPSDQPVEKQASYGDQPGAPSAVEEGFEGAPEDGSEPPLSARERWLAARRPRNDL